MFHHNSPGPALLLVCASQPEAAGLLQKAAFWDFNGVNLYSGRQVFEGVELLITGIGLTNTAFQLGGYLSKKKPKLAIQFGIAGAFDTTKHPMESIVEVTQEAFADLGAQSREGFLDLHAMGFENFKLGEFPMYNRLINPNASLTALPKVSGITVNTVSGEPMGILHRKQLWNADVESMEGAAFFQSCLLADVRFHELRSISNRVEPRNRAAWKIPGALAALHSALQPIIEKARS
jgi:futalosine hydrolase